MDQPQLTQLVTYDPMKRLPYDIWTKCIKFTILKSAAGPLPYIGVSPEWNLALFETPSIWTTIVIEDEEDGPARIHTFLYLSQNSLLDVVCGRSSGSFRSILATNAHRIRSIECPGFTEDFVTILSDISCLFPSLQKLYSPYQRIPTEFLLRCPNLTTINSDMYADDYDQHLYNVREVHLTGVEAKDLTRIFQHSNHRVLGISSSLDYIKMTIHTTSRPGPRT